MSYPKSTDVVADSHKSEALEAPHPCRVCGYLHTLGLVCIICMLDTPVVEA